MYEDGYINIVNVDVSPQAVDKLPSPSIGTAVFAYSDKYDERSPSGYFALNGM
jgi:hypothetical protein